MDQAARLGLERMPPPHQGQLACGPGCAHCCRGTIPVSAPELAGALRHMAGQCSAPQRLRLERNLRQRVADQCPFLIDEKCGVYAMRFFACRQFFIFGQPCRANENVWETRNGDIPRPDRTTKHKALLALATLYNVASPDKETPSFLHTFIMDVSPPLSQWDLRNPHKILAAMDEHILHYRKGHFIMQ